MKACLLKEKGPSMVPIGIRRKSASINYSSAKYSNANLVPECSQVRA
jgi:hypothetical protein